MTGPLLPRKKVAIIGSGCAGIAALWALNRSPHDVYLYEAGSRLGGHTNTAEWENGKERALVDTGFIVMNTATYPNFIRFLEKVDVATKRTEMSFSVSRDHGMFEWAGSSLNAIFCQRGNLFSLSMWRMIFDVVRFNQYALDVLIAHDSCVSQGGEAMGEESIGQYLVREGYSYAFRDDYLLPMAAAVWSTSPDKCALEFPAATLIRFLWNHHLLSTVSTKPDWLTIPGGSKQYIDAVMKGFPPNHILLNTRVTTLSHEEDGRLWVCTDNGKSDIFDHVILATHGDQAYDIIRDTATSEERKIMSCFRTSRNKVVLHSDVSLMPESKRAWSSWNYQARSHPFIGHGSIDQVSLTYNMNILQHLPPQEFGDVLVSLNPLHEPDPESVQGTWEYEHPLYTREAVQAQELLPTIQNKRGLSYVGAWTKYGFHEDGFTSGLKIAQEHLGAKLPFALVDSTFSRGLAPVLGVGDRLLRAWIWTVQTCLISPLDGVMGWFSGRPSLDVNRSNGNVNGCIKVKDH